MPNITNFPTGRVGIGTENPQQTLDVAGTLRVTGSTGTPNSLMGRNASGDVGVVGVGSGLGIDGFGQLYATGGASGSTSGSGSTNQVAYWTGTNVLSGENNLWWDFSADRLGIGTNAPARALDVVGGIRFSTVNGTPTAIIGRDGSGDIGSVSIGTGLGLSGGVLSFTGSTGGSGTVTGTGTTNYLSKWASASGLTDSIVLETGNTIDINGSLRVRTSSGTATNVMGRDTNGYVSNIAVGNGLSVSGGTLSTTGVTFGTGVDGRVAYWTGTNQIGNDNNFLWDAETDRLGIGVFPTSALHISSADSASIRIVKTGTSPADFSLVALNGKLDIGSAFTITDTGRLGLGTNTPAQTLDVAGNMRLTGSTGTSATVMGRSVDGDISAISVGSGLSLSGNILSATGGGGSVSGSGTATQVAFWNGTTSLTGNTNLYWDNNNNRLGIGTSSPSNQLTTTGDASISTLTVGRGNFSLATNTAVGVNALVANVTSLSSGNTAIGYFSLSGNAGVSNTAIGYLSAIKTTGNFNVAVGSDTLTENIGGASNTAVGRAALSNNTSGSSIVAIGANALSNNITGNSSVAVGASAGTLSAAGANLTTASSSIFIGASSRASNISPSNQIVIGTSAVGLADNATVIGTTGTTQTHLYGNLSLGLTSADTTARVKATSSDATSDSFAAKFQNNSGTDILSVRGDGLVGIRTTAPAQTLDIRGTMRLTGSTGDSTTIMGRNASGDVSAISVGSGLSLSGNTLSTTGTTGVSGSGTATQVAFWGGASGSTSTALTSSTGLTWDNVNGRLGIGTASPSQRIHVLGRSLFTNDQGLTAGSYAISEFYRFPSGVGNAGFGVFYTSNGSNVTFTTLYAPGNVDFRIQTLRSSTSTAETNISAFSATTNVSIGSNTDAGYRLNVDCANGTNGLRVLGVNVSSGTNAVLIQNSATTNLLQVVNNGDISFGTALNWNATNTRLGIGTASPSARLHVVGSGTTTGTTFLAQNSGGTSEVRILDNGRISQIIPNANNNTIFGTSAGSSASLSGANNTFFGAFAGSNTTSGDNNTFIGKDSGLNITSGIQNTFVGCQSGLNSTTANNNIFFGFNSGAGNTSGARNIFVGTNSGISNISGNDNLALGFSSNANVSGSYNMFLGTQAGSFINNGSNLTVADNSLFLGYDTRANANSQTNQIVIGYQGRGLGSNTTVIGNSSTTQAHLYGNLTLGLTTADSTTRLKANSSDGTNNSFAAKFQNDSGINIFSVRGDGLVGVGTISPTARLYVKGSTSGNGSTAFEVTDNNDRDIINVRDDGRITLGRNLASNVQSSVTIEAVGTETNIGIAIVPKGNGAITADIPNNSGTGGNARGQYAIDLQLDRVFASEVASGNYSTLLGGSLNSVSGGYSNILGGTNNSITGDLSSIIGGNSNSVSVQYGIICGGAGNQVNDKYASVLGGVNGEAYLYGQNTTSSGSFSTIGDAQSSVIRLRREFTGTATTELYLDGGISQAILKGTNRIWNVRVQSVAVVTSAGGTLVVGDTIAGEYGACIRRIGTTTTIISEQTKIFEHASPNMASAISIVTSVDDSTEALKITYKPPTTAGTGTTFRVVATVYLTEVGF